MRCALGKHDIHGAAKHLDGKYLSFVRKLRKEIRRADPICTRCNNDVINMYNSKLASAIKKAKAKRSLEKKKSQVSDPSVSSTTTTSTATHNDSIDKMVYRTPRNPNLKAVVTESRTGYDSSTSSSTCSTVVGIIATQSESINLSNQEHPQSSQSSLDMEPTTSAAAKRKRDAAQPDKRRSVPQSFDTDAWSDIDSPAVLNGAKLPEVQPILKRRQFVTGNKDIMDIYLSNLTGG